jgi:poly-gamma-glutamate system protein
LKYRPGRVHVLSLVALAVVGFVLLFFAERSKTPVAQRYFTQKLEAATRTRSSMAAIKRARFGEGSEIDVVNDPNETGLIGHEYSLITTSRGAHESKLRALDPNIAAVFVDLLNRAGVRDGDLVAVAVTGAFPVLNAGMLAAIETLGGIPVTITSVGSSMWGANDPAMTWLDMEAVLEREGLLEQRSVAASRGGGDDRGRGLSPDGRDLVDAAIERNGTQPIDEPTLDENIERRMEIYNRRAAGRHYRVYVNIGGGLGSLGSSQVGLLLRPGLSRNLGAKNFPRRGALVRMAEQGIPVIHVPGPESFMERYELTDLAAEGAAPPAVGSGGIFYRDRYNVPLAGVLAVLYAFLIFVVVRIDIKHYLFRRPG